jgi:hypothetical protein
MFFLTLFFSTKDYNLNVINKIIPDIIIIITKKKSLKYQ